MKTICLDLTAAELAQLRDEPWAYVTRLVPSMPGFTETELLGRLPERFVRRITVDGDCWRMGGGNTGKGHAKVSVAGKMRQAHRVVYQLCEESHGLPPLLPGLIIDHVKARGCRHRDCVNPHHGEPVTVKVNTDRGRGVLHQFRRRRPSHLDLFMKGSYL